jgi:hypothetical protein
MHLSSQATQEAEIRKTTVPGQPAQKNVHEKSWMWWYTPVIPATVGSINRRITFRPSQAKNKTLCPK